MEKPDSAAPEAVSSAPAAAGPPPPRHVPASQSPAAGLTRWLYCHNPFYVISASLVFWGLRSSFDVQGQSFHTYALMGGLVGYTLLLAAAAYVVIRLGKVWNDGRSLLLLIVLMFLAMSASFDDVLASNALRGTLCYAGGLALAIAVSEGLLVGLRMRLPAAYRVPYYLLLALFFLYPVAMRWGLPDLYDPARPWAVLGFPALAGVIYLAMLPAAWRGPAGVADNGTPWRWPLYPWSLFFITAVGVCGRTRYLAFFANDLGGDTSIFAPYFLVPFLLAVNLLVLEIATVSRSVVAQRWALLAPAVIVYLASMGPSGRPAVEFLRDTFLPALRFSPLYLTALGVIVLYGWAVVRRIPHAVEALSAALALAAMVWPEAIALPKFRVVPEPWPIAAIALIQAWFALRRGSSPRWLAAWTCLVVAASIPMSGMLRDFGGAILPAHAVFAGMFLIGALGRDGFARFLQHACAALMLAAAMTALHGDRHWVGQIAPMWLGLYSIVVLSLTASLGFVLRNPLYYASAAAGAVVWLGVAGVEIYRYLRQLISGLDYIALGLISLAVAVFISLTKTRGVFQWLDRLRERDK